MKRRVVITGIGTLCSLGTSTDEVWQACLRGESHVTPIPEHWHNCGNFKSQIWAPLPDIDFQAMGVPRVETLRTDPVSLLAYVAAMEALQKAGLPVVEDNDKPYAFNIPGIDPERTAIIMGVAVGGVTSLLNNYSYQILGKVKPKLVKSLRDKLSDEQIEQFADEFGLFEYLHYPPKFNSFVIPMLMPNAVSAYLGIKLSITGVNSTVALACASGAASIKQAYLSIVNGQADKAICGGSEYLNDYYGGSFRGFDVAGTLTTMNDDPLRASRPFDKDRNGFLFSEGGACVLVLEEYNDAVARGAPIVAEIIGSAETFDSYSMMSPAPDGMQAKRMIEIALQDAGLEKQKIDYINTHGTGTQANDLIEAQVIEKVFGDKPIINSTKSLTGHSIGASGAIEAAVTALTLKNQTTHICKNLDAPIADLNFVQESKQQNISVALTQSFAFGGHNVALVMKKAD